MLLIFQARSSLCIQDITMARHPMREVILSASYDESDEVRCHEVPTSYLVSHLITLDQERLFVV